MQRILVWAYERSTHKYLQVKKVIAQPDPIRLRYRDKMYMIIRDIVTGGIVAYTTRVEDFAETIPEVHRAEFVAIVLEELKRLHEGIIARYRIRPSEFESWRQAMRIDR
jgi:hypothetical protein